MDKISADDKILHKTCLRCGHCSKVMQLGNYAALNGVFYCKPHFKQLFAVKGNYTDGFQTAEKKMADIVGRSASADESKSPLERKTTENRGSPLERKHTAVREARSSTLERNMSDSREGRPSTLERKDSQVRARSTTIERKITESNKRPEAHAHVDYDTEAAASVTEMRKQMEDKLDVDPVAAHQHTELLKVFKLLI